MNRCVYVRVCGVDSPPRAAAAVDRFAEEAHRLLAAARATADLSRLQDHVAAGRTRSDGQRAGQHPAVFLNRGFQVTSGCSPTPRWSSRPESAGGATTRSVPTGPAATRRDCTAAADTNSTRRAWCRPGQQTTPNDRPAAATTTLPALPACNCWTPFSERGWLVPDPNQPRTDPLHPHRNRHPSPRRTGHRPRPGDRNQTRLRVRVRGLDGARPHLGGALGHEITAALERAGVITVPRDARAVTVHAPLTTWLDTYVDLAPSLGVRRSPLRREYVGEIVRQRLLQLLVRAGLRVPVRPPAVELGGVSEPGALHRGGWW